MSIEDELGEVLARVECPAHLESYLSAIIRDTLELCRHHEDGIALENLCDNLFEESVPISAEVRESLQRFCARFDVDARRRALLDQLALACKA